MAIHRGRLLQEVGERLRTIREQLKHSPADMARRLGLSYSGYFKNESGITFPKVTTLHVLQDDFGISMDWLIFNKGPMHYKDRQQELRPEEKGTKTSRLEDRVPEVQELLDHMEEDVLFRHKVLVYFYEYKKGQPSPEEEPSPSVPTEE